MVWGLQCGQNMNVSEDWLFLYLLNNCHERVAVRIKKGRAGTMETEPYRGIKEKNTIQN